MEDYCIRELRIQTNYNNNNKADSICILSIICSSLNEMYIPNSVPRRWRSQGHRHDTYPILYNISFITFYHWHRNRLVCFTFEQDYIHHSF